MMDASTIGLAWNRLIHYFILILSEEREGEREIYYLIFRVIGWILVWIWTNTTCHDQILISLYFLIHSYFTNMQYSSIAKLHLVQLLPVFFIVVWLVVHMRICEEQHVCILYFCITQKLLTLHLGFSVFDYLQVHTTRCITCTRAHFCFLYCTRQAQTLAKNESYRARNLAIEANNVSVTLICVNMIENDIDRGLVGW